MYLSRLVLDPSSPHAQAELVWPYEMHRTVMCAYPRNLLGERVLFRVDLDRGSSVPTVLVQSRGPADWSSLRGEDDHLLKTADEVAPNPAQKQFAPDFAAGQVLLFRLRANPTFRRGRRRLAWLEEEQQLAWLRRKGLAGGFDLLTATVRQEGMIASRKCEGASTSNLSLYSVVFEGLLRVTSPAALSELLSRGVGSGKAFGFGLLSLAAVR